jgi:hypothetical protein
LEHVLQEAATIIFFPNPVLLDEVSGMMVCFLCSANATIFSFKLYEFKVDELFK